MNATEIRKILSTCSQMYRQPDAVTQAEHVAPPDAATQAEHATHSDVAIHARVLDLLWKVRGIKGLMLEHDLSWKFWFADEGEWYTFEVNCSPTHGNPNVYGNMKLNYVKIADIVEDLDSSTNDGQDFQIQLLNLLDWISEHVEEDIRLIAQGRYEQEVLEQIPLDYRVGLLEEPQGMNMLKHLPPYNSRLGMIEIRNFKRLEAYNYRILKTPLVEYSLEDFFQNYAEAVKICMWPITEGASNQEIYLQYAGESHAQILRTNPDITLEQWFEMYSVSAGCYRVLPIDASCPVAVWICKDEVGYFLQVICNDWKRMDDAVRFYLALVAQHVPAWLPNGRQYQDLVFGSRRIAVLPKNCMTDVKSSLYPCNTFVSGTMTAKEAAFVQFPLKIKWQPLILLEEADERDHLTFGKI